MSQSDWNTISIQHEIDDLRAKIEGLEALKLHLKGMNPVEHAAIALHDTFCTHNHIDGCGWMYEIDGGIHDWTRSEHGRWWHRANLVLAECERRGITFEEGLNLAQLMRHGRI